MNEYVWCFIGGALMGIGYYIAADKRYGDMWDRKDKDVWKEVCHEQMSS